MDEHIGKAKSLLGTDPHHVAQKEDVVWLESDFLCIENDLLKLSRFGKALNDLKRKNTNYLILPLCGLDLLCLARLL